MRQLRSWHLSTLKVVSEPMSALVRTSESDCRTRTTGENCTASESRTRTKYSYDQLNRLTKKTYSDSTPTATFTFDQGTYAKSRLTGMTDGAGTASWTYDADGRILSEQRTIVGVTKTISYAYALDGSLETLTYPSGHNITYNVGNAERPTSAVDSTGGINYVGSVSSQPVYAPTAGLANVLLGQVSSGFGGITHAFTYNSRLEINTIQASSTNGTALNMSYCFYQLQGGNSCPVQSSGNNGNISGIINNLDTNRTQTMTYDPLDRLLTAQSQATSGSECWGQSFGIDALANLSSETVTKCTAPSLSLSVNGSNQITNTGFSYDAAGNMTSDSQYTYAYDAEGRMSTASGMTGGPYCYVYDGNGLRVVKSNANGASCTQATVDVIYWRDIWGNAIAETDSSGNTTNANYHEYAFFAGRRVARRDGSGPIYYFFNDHLGSLRSMTDSNGNKCYDTDYFPDGAEVGPFTNTCSDHYKFTGYERDSETGIDYAFARYYNPRTGRFLSPDPLDGSTSAPQSLNRYAYVQNNCTNLVDPFGLDCGVIIGGGTQTPGTAETAEEKKLATDASAMQAYPYSNLTKSDTMDRLTTQAYGGETDATRVAENAIMAAGQQQSGPINIVTFSAGASAYLSALPNLPKSVVSRIKNVVYLMPIAPGLDLANGKGTGETTAYYGHGGTELGLHFSYPASNSGVQQKDVDCTHDANCAVKALQAKLKLALGYPCANALLFRRGGGGGGGSGPAFYFTFYTACSEGGCSSVITGGIWIWPLPAPRAVK
jgi:RHS repeat-associated protein